MSNLFFQFIILINRAFAKNLLLILLFFLVSVRSAAQITDNKSHTYETVVSGNVSDNNGFPLTGASLIVKGTTNGTTTNFDGNFSLDIEIGANIIISYAGFKTKEITVENWIEIDITLEEEVKSVAIDTLTIRPEYSPKTRAEIRKARRANRVKHQATAAYGLEFMGEIVKAIMRNNR